MKTKSTEYFVVNSYDNKVFESSFDLNEAKKQAEELCKKYECPVRILIKYKIVMPLITKKMCWDDEFTPPKA